MQSLYNLHGLNRVLSRSWLMLVHLKRFPQSSLPVVSEVSERPKLKLLPQTKPLDNLGSPVIDPKQGHQWLYMNLSLIMLKLVMIHMDM